MIDPPQASVPLTLDNLRKLDFGKIGAAFDTEMERVVKDMEDRPGDKNPRKVQINFTMRPVASTDSNTIYLDTVGVEAEVTSIVPKRRTKIYSMQPKQNGKLVFQPHSPDDPSQQELYRDDEERAG